MSTSSSHEADREYTTSDDDISEETVDRDRAMAMALLRTVIPVIVLMGTVGNALSFCVLVRRRMRSTPMYFYLTLLAVADTFVLYVSAFKVWIRATTQFELLHLSNFGCKLFMFTLLCSFYMSAWLVVLVTLDRFLVVWFPFRGYLLMRIRRARLTATVLAAIVAGYNIHVFWTFGLQKVGSTQTCDGAEDNFFMMHVFEYLKLVSYCVVPFFIVFTLNVGILCKINSVYAKATMTRESGQQAAAVAYRQQPPLVILRQSWSPSAGDGDGLPRAALWPQRQRAAAFPERGRKASESSRHSSASVQKLRQRRLTRMLLFISFAWLVFTAPFTLHSFLPPPSPASSSFPSHGTSNSSNFSLPMNIISMTTGSTSSQWMRSAAIKERSLSEASQVLTSSTSIPPATTDPSRYLLVKTICFLLVYVNHAANFYLYCLSGKRFRQELATMLNLDCLSCVIVDDELAADPVDIGAVPERNDRYNLKLEPQFDGGKAPNHQAPSSTSSRTRAARAKRRSHPDERYS